MTTIRSCVSGLWMISVGVFMASVLLYIYGAHEQFAVMNALCVASILLRCALYAIDLHAERAYQREKRRRLTLQRFWRMNGPAF